MTDVRRRPKRSKFSSEESGNSSASSSLTSSSSSDEETDAKDLKPIKEYISNRKEMASQLFKSVKTDKIRLMLPQILKKVDFNDLEELCANELIGMSKARILSIVNGQEMLQSSETEDSDDSGPSLEIVSDTEWLSADDIGIKIEGKKKGKDKKNKKVQDQSKQEVKPKLKSKEKVKGAKVKLEKVKTEGKDKSKEKEKEKAKDKEKEGETLLDLLELEMRARAIRALIRKEEDATKVVQSNGANSSEDTSNSNEQNSKTRQANLKKQLQKIDVLMKHGEDEDVYVVINPAPTIELLSSDSDNENNSKRVNQKFANERKSESENGQNKDQLSTSRDKEKSANKEKDLNQENGTVNDEVNKEKENDKETDNEKDKAEKPKEKDKAEKPKEKDKSDKPKEKDKSDKAKEKDKLDKHKEKENKNDNLPMSVIENNSSDKIENESKKESDLEEGEILDDEDDGADNINKEENVTEQLPSKNIKKIKKNPHIRSKKNSRDSDEESIELNSPKPNEKIASAAEVKLSKSKNEKLPVDLNEPIEIEESPERPKEADTTINSKNDKEESSLKIDLFDDKSLDIEEIINLDDYPDDMDDLERSRSNVKEKKSKETNKNLGSEETSKPTSETWATRYYQQDDVQSVIRESKIQSEIRKRLRERQRQNKLNNSPKLNQEPPQPSTQEIVHPKPTGSVKEYLALKGQCSSNSQDKTEGVGFSTTDNITMESSNDASQTESTAENIIPSTQSDTIANQSIVIVKKAKLNENISIVKKIDTSTLDEVENVKQISETGVQNELIEIKESPERPKDIDKMNVPMDVKEEGNSKKQENLIMSSKETRGKRKKSSSNTDDGNKEEISSNKRHENMDTSSEETCEKRKNCPSSDIHEDSEKEENPKIDEPTVNQRIPEKEETGILKERSTVEAHPMSPTSDSSEDNVVVKIGNNLTTPNERTEPAATSELRPD